ncbi:MAG: imidazoleglycerol-phosphate dehydratase HisB [Christensenellales bacterium]|jgi:imidazoleglycerol-phosphate dehydratase
MRTAKIDRKTKETDIYLELCLDGIGKRQVEIGIGFLEHMLELFASHGNFDLTVKCSGDINVDYHHTVEDIGICLGKAISKALNDKKGIRRYASVTIPMDEALTTVSLDLSGRPYLVYNVDISGKSGDFDVELIEEFFRAVSTYGGITLHINNLYGGNNHHIIESAFKAFTRALSEASEIISDNIPSSKGMLE